MSMTNQYFANKTDFRDHHIRLLVLLLVVDYSLKEHRGKMDRGKWNRIQSNT